MHRHALGEDRPGWPGDYYLLTTPLLYNEDAAPSVASMKKCNPPQRLLIGWLGLIFITSCFVVPFGTFIRFIQGLSRNSSFQQWFDRFWVGDWFFVVKGWHMTEYAVLVSLTILALRRWHLGSRAGSIWLAFAFAVAFAASDEWHQTFVPGRDGCLRDVLIDTGGALLAALCWSAQLWRINHRAYVERATSARP